LVTAEGERVFSTRLARLCAAVAFVPYQPGKRGLLLAPARPGEAPNAINDAVSATMAKMRVRVIFRMILLPIRPPHPFKNAGRLSVIRQDGKFARSW
jgi:hypothetical protein